MRGIAASNNKQHATTTSMLARLLAAAMILASSSTASASSSASTAHLFPLPSEPITVETILMPFDDNNVAHTMSWDVLDAMNALREELHDAGFTMEGIAGVMHSIISPSTDTEGWKREALHTPLYLYNLEDLISKLESIDHAVYKERVVKLSSRLGLLVRLFYMGQWVLKRDLEALAVTVPLLSDDAMRTLNSLGLFFFAESPVGTIVRSEIMFNALAPAGSILAPLILATDHYMLPSYEISYDPVMYLGIDSYALVGAAPRPQKGTTILDTCTGSGVQGIAASAFCAVSGGECSLLLNDLNPRAVRFARFNLAMNFHALPGLLRPKRPAKRQSINELSIWLRESVWLSDITTLASAVEAGKEGPLALRFHAGFDLMLANPPYLPDPRGGCELYGGGGDIGDDILLEVVKAAAGRRNASHGLLKRASGTNLAIVGNVANINSLSARLQTAWSCDDDDDDDRSQQRIDAQVVHAHGTIFPTREYAKMRMRSTFEWGIEESLEKTASAYHEVGIVDVSPHSLLFFQNRYHTQGTRDTGSEKITLPCWNYKSLDLGGALWERVSGMHGGLNHAKARAAIYQLL